MVIPCGLSLLGFIQASGGSVPASVSGRSVERKRLTYVDWTEGGPSPASFFDLTAPLLAAGRGEGCLFLRKLKLPDTSKISEEAIHRKKIDLSTIWIRLVLGIDVLGADLSGKYFSFSL